MTQERPLAEIVREHDPLAERSSYRWLLRLGRARVVVLFTTLTVLASCALTALALVVSLGVDHVPTIAGLWRWSMATAVLVPAILCPLIVLVMMDMLSRLEQVLRSMHRLAGTDTLTGLRNRGNFLGEAERMLDRGEGGREPIAMLMVDIDDFKRINDTHGHLAGDHALSVVAMICAGALSSQDMCARFGGEEFAAVLRGDSATRSTDVAEAIRDRVAQAVARSGVAATFQVTVSIGVAGVDEAGYNLPALIALADERLYQAKRSGKNRVVADGAGEA